MFPWEALGDGKGLLRRVGALDFGGSRIDAGIDVVEDGLDDHDFDSDAKEKLCSSNTMEGRYIFDQLEDGDTNNHDRKDYN